MYDQFFKGLLLACKEVDDCVIDKASAKIDQILSSDDENSNNDEQTDGKSRTVCKERRTVLRGR